MHQVPWPMIISRHLNLEAAKSVGISTVEETHWKSWTTWIFLVGIRPWDMVWVIVPITGTANVKSSACWGQSRLCNSGHYHLSQQHILNCSIEPSTRKCGWDFGPKPSVWLINQLTTPVLTWRIRQRKVWVSIMISSEGKMIKIMIKLVAAYCESWNI